jgi:hypothetical protein
MSEAVTLGLFTLGGVALTSTFAWLVSGRETKRDLQRLAREHDRLDRVRRADLLREGAVGVAQSWAKVVQADSARLEAEQTGQDDPGLSPTVEPLTELGLNLNKLLVLPTSERFREQTMKVDEILSGFRGAFLDPRTRSEKRKEVGAAILELLAAAREEGTV